MADTLTITGRLKITPSNTALSDPSLDPWPLDETLVLSRRITQTVNLDADGAESVSLGDLTATGFHFCRIETAENLQITAALTSSLGTSQLIAGNFIILRSDDTPYTALTLQRVTGVTTRAVVLLGQI